MANYLVIAEVDTNIVHGYTAPPRIKCEQYDGDYTRLIHATLYNGDQKYTIPSEVRRITVSGIKPDGTGFSYDCTWSGAVVSLSLMRQMTVVYGEVPCNITLLNSAGNQLSTAVIVLDVERAALQDTVLESSNDFQTIIDYLQASELYAQYSKSYAVGHTGIRTGENTDNSEYYHRMTGLLRDSTASFVGSPLTVTQAADMTNTDKIYVYVGEESGYNYGSWYYYDQETEQWREGGVYNSTADKNVVRLVVSDMKADTALAVGMTVQTLGYYEVNDGGGALYRIRSTQPTTYSESITNGLYAELIMPEVVTPKMFGAVADGDANDTIAFQNALNSGNTVLVPEGTYLVSGLSIPNMGTVVGCGRKSIIKGDGTGHTITIPSSASYCTLDSLTVYGILGDDTYNAIEIANKSDEDAGRVFDAYHRLTNIATLYGHYGIRVGVSIRGCRVEGLTISQATSDGLRVDGTDNAFLNVSVSLCGGNGIYLHQNNRLASAKAFRNDGYSIYLNGFSNNITRLDIQQTNGSGIFIGNNGGFNYVQFVSDGVGYGNTDYNGNISLIVLGVTGGNVLVGTVRNGTLSGMMNHIISVQNGTYPFGNRINVTYAEARNQFPLRDVMAVSGGILNPSNEYIVNGTRIYSGYNLSIPSEYNLIYYNSSGTFIDTPSQSFDTFGTEITVSDFNFNTVSVNSGLNIRFGLKEPINAQYIYVRAYISANVDITKSLGYQIITRDGANIFSVPYYNGAKPSDGYIEGIFAYPSIEEVRGIRLALRRITSESVNSPTPIVINIKEVEIWTK